MASIQQPLQLMDKNIENSSSSDHDVFKQWFKFYKSKTDPPDLSDVIDFQCQEKFEKNGIKQFIPDSTTIWGENNLGLTTHHSWNIYTSNKCEGLIFIENPFTELGQQQWIKKCMWEYLVMPNRTNIECIKDDLRLEDGSLHTRNWLNFLQNLRWITLGYHHNWDTKEYSFENQTPFPSDLAKLTSFIARVLNFEKYNAEAAIVNFYHLNSTLSGHVDHSENDLNAPLFSISFGQPAIFLLGGKTRTVKPSAMYLRSGDIIVMAGSSRLAYHAVPKILQCKAAPWKVKSNDTEWTNSMETYMEKSRINVNVRQVFAIS